MKTYRHPLSVLACCLLSITLGYAQHTSNNDALLHILQQESKNLSNIVTEKAFPVTNVLYEVEDVQQYNLRVDFGSISKRDKGHTRTATVLIETANTDDHITTCGQQNEFFIPLDDDEETMHLIFQQALQKAYQQSIQSYHVDKSGFLAPAQSPDRSLHPDYRPLPTHVDFNEQELIAKLKNSTQLFSSLPEVIVCHASIDYNINRTYEVSQDNATAYNKISTVLYLKMTRTTDEGLISTKAQYFDFENPDDIFTVDKLQEVLWELYRVDDNGKADSIPPLQTLFLKNWWMEADTCQHEQASLLDIMQEMAKNGVDSLYYEEMPKPYHLSYLVSDAHIAYVTTSLGCIIEEEEYDKRSLTTNVRVGSDVRNNEHIQHDYLGRQEDNWGFPLDNDPVNIKRQLWYSAAQNYPLSAKNYQYKELSRARLAEEPGASLPDRSEAITENLYDPMPLRHECLPQLKNLACEFSQIMGRTRPKSGVSIQSFQANAYYADNTGLQYVQPVVLTQIIVWDETSEYVSKDFFFKGIDELEQFHPMLVNDIEQFRSQLDMHDALAIAMDEVYDGPVLVVGDAAAQFFAEAFLNYQDGLVATRQPVKISTYGIYPNTTLQVPLFIDKPFIHPDISISATDHDQYSGQGGSLIGSYKVDAEGVPVDKKVEIVHNGELVTLLSNREPTAQIGYSNGHQRFAILNEDKLVPTCGPGVLTMECRNRMTYKKLLKQLLDKARKAGYDHAYIILETGGSMNYPMGLYRINIHNQKALPVKNARMMPITYKTFQTMSCALKDTRAFNLTTPTYSLSFQVPCSLVMPTALLFDKVTLVVK